MAEKNRTIQETANIFRKSKKTIYRWIEEGKVFKRYIRVKDGILIPQSEIDRIMIENEVIVEIN